MNHQEESRRESPRTQSRDPGVLPEEFFGAAEKRSQEISICMIKLKNKNLHLDFHFSKPSFQMK